MLSEKGGLLGNCLCFNDSWNMAFSGQVEFCQWYRGSICMTAISRMKMVEFPTKVYSVIQTIYSRKFCE